MLFRWNNPAAIGRRIVARLSVDAMTDQATIVFPDAFGRTVRRVCPAKELTPLEEALFDTPGPVGPTTDDRVARLEREIRAITGDVVDSERQAADHEERLRKAENRIAALEGAQTRRRLSPAIER
jgi:hypothetical protein